MKLIRCLLLFVLIVVSIIYIRKQRREEGMADVTLSSEAIQNIASVYNKDNLTVTNLTTTKDITAAGNIKGVNVEATGNIKGANAEVTGNIKSKDSIEGKALNTSGGINAPNGWGTHFPFISNGVVDKNYIRGDTVVDGSITMNKSIDVNGNFKLNGVDIRDMMIGCSLFDQPDMNDWNNIPFNFPIGKFSLEGDGNWKNDSFDYIRVNPGFKVTYFNNFRGKTDDFSKTITNTTPNPILEVLQPRNALSSLIVEKA